MQCPNRNLIMILVLCCCLSSRVEHGAEIAAQCTRRPRFLTVGSERWPHSFWGWQRWPATFVGSFIQKDWIHCWSKYLLHIFIPVKCKQLFHLADRFLNSLAMFVHCPKVKAVRFSWVQHVIASWQAISTCLSHLWWLATRKSCPPCASIRTRISSFPVATISWLCCGIRWAVLLSGAKISAMKCSRFAFHLTVLSSSSAPSLESGSLWMQRRAKFTPPTLTATNLYR